MFSGTDFFLDILVLSPGIPGLSAAPVCSRAPGVPLRRAALPRSDRNAPSRLRRAEFISVPLTRGDVEEPDFLLSRIDLPMRMFSELLIPVVGLRVAEFREAEMEGVLPVIEVAMREVLPPALPTVEVLSELTAGCLATVVVEGLCVSVELPMRDLNMLSCDLDMLSCDLDRLLELAAGCLAPVEADGLSIRIELLATDSEPGAGLSILIERPTRDVSPVSILYLELEIDPPLGGETDGRLVMIELPIREVLSELIRMLELLPTEVESVALLLTDILDDGPRELDDIDGRETVIRLDVDPLGAVREDVVPKLLGATRLTDTPLELLLRLGTDRLDEIELERFGVDRLAEVMLELLRLAVDRLDETVLERLGAGALLTVGLLELLRLDTDLLLELRLAETELDLLGAGARLGVGARLTDDLLGVLRVGAGARLGAAGLAACAV